MVLFTLYTDQFQYLSPRMRYELFTKILDELFARFYESVLQCLDNFNTSYYPISGNNKGHHIHQLVYAVNSLEELNQMFKEWSIDSFYLDMLPFIIKDYTLGVFDDLINNFTQLSRKIIYSLSKDYFESISLDLKFYTDSKNWINRTAIDNSSTEFLSLLKNLHSYQIGLISSLENEYRGDLMKLLDEFLLENLILVSTFNQTSILALEYDLKAIQHSFYPDSLKLCNQALKILKLPLEHPEELSKTVLVQNLDSETLASIQVYLPIPQVKRLIVQSI